MSSSSSSSKKNVYYSEPYHFEKELESELLLDDDVILKNRYEKRQAAAASALPPCHSSKVRSIKSQTQWTRSLDAVQEHFSSHVTLDGVCHKLPPSIYALKVAAKHAWFLYKKRECERRKRIRKKLEREKEKEKEGKPSNILMAMVDMCEKCKRLYVTVNLFWG